MPRPAEPSRRGVYPGSFNPLTVAHLAIADAARRRHDLDHVDLVVSRVALAKEHVDRPLLEHRLEVIEAEVRRVAWLHLVVTDHQLLVDIAEGYDVLVMGADKWSQVNDPAFYGGSEQARDAALARLPTLAIAPRPPHAVPDQHRLTLPPRAVEVSSTEARHGQRQWMTAAAAAFDELSGAWTDPARYERWLRDNRGAR